MATPELDETISSSELVRRILAVVDERCRAGSLAPAPQGLVPPDVPRAPSDVYPWQKRDDSPSMALPRPLSIQVRDFVELPTDRFVTYCHHALLGRDPTTSDRAAWTRRASRGWPRIAIVLAIRWSAGGRRHGTRLKGIPGRVVRDVAFLLHRLGRRGGKA